MTNFSYRLRYICTALAQQNLIYRLRYVRTALARKSICYRLRYVRSALARLSLSFCLRYVRTAKGTAKPLASPIRSLDFTCAKAWQTLATVTLSVHLVCSSKARLSLSPRARSTLRDQAANTSFDHDALQQCSIQFTYDSLYGLPTSTTCSSIAGSSPRTTRCTG